MTEFKDHFSRGSVDYARYRPGYPAALFDWLASLVPAHDLAWDVGTGSGQAAIGLAGYFQQVIATDPAEAQLRNAARHPRILYKVMPAERTDIADASVDLVTVAQAIHWFDFDRFYAEVKRVLKRGSAIAVWTYGLTEVSADVDAIYRRYYKEIVGPYWPPERRYVEKGYRTIPFPFEEIQAPPLAMREQWTPEQYLGYLGTWSASQTYVKQHGKSPLDLIRESVVRAWGGDQERRVVTWPLYMRAGRIS